MTHKTDGRALGDPRKAERSGGQRLDIQGMRGLAVLLVVLSHAGISSLAGGYVGVDVFFVLSGFLITGILVREASREGRVSIGRFYGNRAKRILPVSALVLAVSTVAGSLILNEVRARTLFDDIQSAAIFVANWRFALTETDYFSSSAPPSAVQHYWSLAVEEQFYFVWPLLIGLVFLGVTHTHQSRDSRRNLLGGLLIIVTGLSLAWSVVQTSQSPSFAYFSTLTRAWELGVGGLLAIFSVRLRRVPAPVLAALSWVGLAAVGGAAVFFTEATAFPGDAALLPVLGTACMLAGGMAGSRWGARVILEVRPLCWVGDISYSLYLWHWPLLILGGAYLQRALTTSEALLLMAAAVVLSAASYYLVENPVRQKESLRDDPKKALIFWPATVAIVIVPIGLLGPALLVNNNQQAAAAAQEADAAIAKVKAPNGTISPLQVAVALAQRGTSLPSFSPLAANLARDVEYMPSECRSGSGESVHTVCELGKKNGTKSIVLMGDSTAAMLVPGMARAAKTEGWSFKPLVKYQCPASDVVQILNQKPFQECGAWRSWASGQVADLHPDVLILAGLTNLKEATQAGAPVRADADAWERGTERTIRDVKGSAGSAVVLGELPRPSTEPVDCLSNPQASMRDCSFGIDNIGETARVASAAAASAGGARYIDWVDWFCDQGVCPEVIGSHAVWADKHHLTATYSTLLSKRMARSLRRMLS